MEPHPGSQSTSCYRCNRCSARCNRPVICAPHTLLRHSTGEVNAGLVSTGRRYREAAPSRRRSFISRCQSDPPGAARFGGAIKDDAGNLVARFRDPGWSCAVPAVDLPMSARSAGRSLRSGREGTAAWGHGAAGKPLVASGPVVAGHRYPRVPGLRSVAFAAQSAASVSPCRAPAEAPRRGLQTSVPRASGCAGRAVAV